VTFFDCIRFFVGVFVSFAVDVEDGSSALIGLISLHPVGALSYGLQVIGTLEDQDIGLQGNTLGSSDTSSGWTVEDALQYFLIDTLIYGFLVSVSFAFTSFLDMDVNSTTYMFDRLGISIAPSNQTMVSLCLFGSHLLELTGFRAPYIITLAIQTCSKKKSTLQSHLKLLTEDPGKKVTIL
jgi:flagellar biosynthesis protein FliP